MLNRAQFASIILGVPALAVAADLGITSPAGAQAAADPLPSWNAGAAKTAILDFVRKATDASGPDFVAPEDRIATFDQDGTMWVEHPLYTELMFSLDRIGALAPEHPEWKTTEPFKSVLAGDQAAIAKFTMKDLEAIVAVTHSGMTTEDFRATAAAWAAKASDSRWHRPYTDLVYQPMLEVMQYLRANGFKTYIVTGGGQNFVRSFAQRVYGVPPEQVIGSAGKTDYTYAKDGRAILVQEPSLLLNNNLSGKAEDINLVIGSRPHAAFGNSSGDQQMLEYTQGNTGARLMMLVLHDDATREYAYGPATGLPDSQIGTFPQTLYDEAQKNGWNVISMKNDWKRIFAF
jgi:phosphoglycolate phosphatase-like HAD superfamily hydrolase